jgi:hypothetical protein
MFTSTDTMSFQITQPTNHTYSSSVRCSRFRKKDCDQIKIRYAGQTIGRFMMSLRRIIAIRIRKTKIRTIFFTNTDMAECIIQLVVDAYL